MNKLIVSLSPHVHGGDSVKKNMYGVLIALIPAFLVSLYFFGLGALIVTATSVAACLFFEWAIGKFLMKKETTTITDGSAIITGVLLAYVNELTKEPIAQANAKTLSDAVSAVVPGFDNDPIAEKKMQEVNGVQYSVYPATKGGEYIGAAV